MSNDVFRGWVELGKLGRLPKRKPTRKNVLEYLDSIEERIGSMRLPTARKITALYMVRVLKSKTKKYWNKLSKGEGAFLIEDDMVRLKRMLDNPLKEYSAGSAGSSKDEKNMNALFRWMEDELSLPYDETIEHISLKIDDIRSDAKSLGNDIIIDEFRHNASKLSGLVERKIEVLNKLRSQLKRYV